MQLLFCALPTPRSTRAHSFAQVYVAEGSAWCSLLSYLSPQAPRAVSPNASGADAAGDVGSLCCQALPGPKQAKCTLGTMNAWLVGGRCGSAQGIAAVLWHLTVCSQVLQCLEVSAWVIPW